MRLSVHNGAVIIWQMFTVVLANVFTDSMFTHMFFANVCNYEEHAYEPWQRYGRGAIRSLHAFINMFSSAYVRKKVRKMLVNDPCVWPQTMENMNNPNIPNYENSKKCPTSFFYVILT